MTYSKIFRLVSFSAFLITAILVTELAGQETASKKLVIGTRHVPPFAIKNADGTWDGLSIEMWKSVAEKLGVEYEFRDYSLKELLQRVETGELDAVVAALSVTAEREEKIDYSHPFLTSGLGVAIRKNDRSFRGSFFQLLVWPLTIVTSVTVVLLFVAGFIVWAVEKKRNPENFGGHPVTGIGQGIWWAAATMTTVGYGDIAPRTFVGRTIAVIWMLVGIVIVSLFTAFVASRFTTAQFAPTVRTIGDLSKVHVGTIQDTTASDFLQRNGIPRRLYDEPQQALSTLKDGGVSAVVYDRPSLRYMAITEYPSITVLPTIFEEEYYAVAFPSGSNLREQFNRKLLVYLQSDSWKRVRMRYLGQ